MDINQEVVYSISDLIYSKLSRDTYYFHKITKCEGKFNKMLKYYPMIMKMMIKDLSLH